MSEAALSEFDGLEITPLIAARPAEPRDSSRLMTLSRGGSAMKHGTFRDLPGLLKRGDVLVLNRSRVWKARLPARKPTGGNSELLLIRAESPDLRSWSALVRKMSPGAKVLCAGGAEAVCVRRDPDGSFLFSLSEPLTPAYLEKHAEVPLPQYILKARRKEDMPEGAVPDDSRYQTVFAGETGSIAAPTAGFHFTPELLESVKAAGARVCFVTLHIGWGTFRPVRAEDPASHVMLAEACSVPAETAEAVNSARSAGGRVIAVGTSSMRTLESFAAVDGRIASGAREASLFIRPGYKFRVAAAFITNLHVPSSAPLYMTAAFAGREPLFRAYAEAVKLKYRFYSYGDSMFIS